MTFLHVILPLITLLFTGALLQRLRLIDPKPLSDVVLYILLPVLLFVSLVRYPIGGHVALVVVAWHFIVSLMIWGIVALVSHLARWDQQTSSAVTLSLTGLNLATYGLPIVVFLQGNQALAPIMVLVAAGNVFMSTFGVYIAAASKFPARQAVASIFKLPLVYAVALALAVNTADVMPPTTVLDFAESIGRAAPPLGMIVLGIQLASIPLRGNTLLVLGSTTAAKLVGVPAVGIAMALLMNNDARIKHTLMICACLPTAINYLLLAVRFDARADLVAGVLLISTLLSPLMIGLVLAVVG